MKHEASKNLRAGWRIVRLSEVVENINEFFDRKINQVVRYVAGEHIDEGDIRVRRHGLTSDDLVPPTFNRLFKAGDVLFHSRNIRKLAQPDFDGLTGEKLFVLRTRNASKLEQAFLPYLLQGTHFFDYVEGRWAGSTNKFLNKTPLMAYEFELPSIGEQKAIVQALSCADQMVAAFQDAMNSAQNVFESAALEFFESSADKWPRKRIEQVSLFVTNGFVGKSAQHYVAGRGVPYLVSKNIRRNRLKLDELTYISEDFHNAARKSQLREGDILTVQSGHIGETAVVPREFAGANCHALIITRPDLQELDPYFASYYLNSSVGQRRLSKLVIGSTIQHLNTSDLRRLEIPQPSLEEQRKIAALLSALGRDQEILAARTEATSHLRYQMLAGVFT